MRNIYVKNNTINTKIIMTDANDEIIFAEEYKRTNARLMDDDMIVDRKTIAELCGMTEEEFTSKYDLKNCESQRVFGEWALMYAEFEERKEEPRIEIIIPADNPERTVEDVLITFLLERGFEVIGMKNTIEHLYHLPLYAIAEKSIELIIKTRDLMINLDQRNDYGDQVREAIIELNTLLDRLGRY